VVLAAPAISACLPSCGEQELAISVLPRQLAVQGFADVQWPSAAAERDGHCPSGGAKGQHTVLLSVCQLYGGESLNVIYSRGNVNRSRKVKMQGNLTCAQHPSFLNSALQLKAEALCEEEHRESLTLALYRCVHRVGTDLGQEEIPPTYD